MECPDELCYKMLAEAHSVQCPVIARKNSARCAASASEGDRYNTLYICRFELDIESARRIRTLRHETLQRGICRRRELELELGFRFGYEDFPQPNPNPHVLHQQIFRCTVSHRLFRAL